MTVPLQSWNLLKIKGLSHVTFTGFSVLEVVGLLEDAASVFRKLTGSLSLGSSQTKGGDTWIPSSRHPYLCDLGQVT